VTAPGIFTGAIVTNASSQGVTLAVEIVNGDPGEQWQSTSCDCYVTPNETTLFLFTHVGNGQSLAEFECSETGAGPTSPPARLSVPRAEISNAATGIMFVAATQGGAAVGKNVLFGDVFVTDVAQGDSWSASGIPFQSRDPLAQDGNKQYRFDGLEYTVFPSALVTSFVAPSEDVTAELILFTLDGTAHSGPVPVKLGVTFYNDDERRRDASFQFDCFTIASLDEDVDPRFAASALGSPVGNLVLTPQSVGVGFSPHELTGSGVDFFRRTPAHGWLVQTVSEGAVLFDEQAGDVYSSQPAAGAFPDGPDPGLAGESVASFARTLAQSLNPHLPLAGDVVNFDAR
jgi:hypothetical protein